MNEFCVGIAHSKLTYWEASIKEAYDYLKFLENIEP